MRQVWLVLSEMLRFAAGSSRHEKKNSKVVCSAFGPDSATIWAVEGGA